MCNIAQALKGTALLDFGKALGLSLEYMAAPKATVIYPFERSPRSLLPGGSAPRP